MQGEMKKIIEDMRENHPGPLAIFMVAGVAQKAAEFVGGAAKKPQSRELAINILMQSTMIIFRLHQGEPFEEELADALQLTEAAAQGFADDPEMVEYFQALNVTLQEAAVLGRKVVTGG